MHGHDCEKAAALDAVTTPGSFLGLRLLQHGDQAEEVGMLALADGDLLTTERLKQVGFAVGNALTEIRCQAHKSASGWSLTQHSHTVSCAVNDAALKYGQTVAVRKGDRIELGMLCLVVAEDEVVDKASTRLPTTSADEEGSQLAQNAALDPFAHLPRFQPDMHSDTLAFYAGPPAKQDVIDELAGDYMMAITDPTARQRQTMATGTLLGAMHTVSTQQESEQTMPAHFSLEDVLSGQLSIEQVLAGIGTEDTQWAKPERTEDVLMLFADGVVRRAQSHLPDLTRREHHAISPDSHVAMGRSADDSASPDAIDKTIPHPMTK